MLLNTIHMQSIINFMTVRGNSVLHVSDHWVRKDARWVFSPFKGFMKSNGMKLHWVFFLQKNVKPCSTPSSKEMAVILIT